jgi:hypothetical protein
LKVIKGYGAGGHANSLFIQMKSIGSADMSATAAARTEGRA